MSQIDRWKAELAEPAVFGANVQPGQLVAITSYIGKEDVTRRNARAAYGRGAKYVDVVYFDQWVKRERILHAADDTLDFVPPWMRERLLLVEPADVHDVLPEALVRGAVQPERVEVAIPSGAGRSP